MDINYTLNVTNQAAKDRFIEGTAKQNCYQDQIPDPDYEGAGVQMIDNPETIEQFFDKMITRFIVDSTRAFEKDTAVQVVQDAIPEDLDDLIV